MHAVKKATWLGIVQRELKPKVEEKIPEAAQVPVRKSTREGRPPNVYTPSDTTKQKTSAVEFTEDPKFPRLTIDVKPEQIDMHIKGIIDTGAIYSHINEDYGQEVEDAQSLKSKKQRHLRLPMEIQLHRTALLKFKLVYLLKHQQGKIRLWITKTIPPEP